jgi:hypothetical protein
LQVDGPAGVRPEELGGQHHMDLKGPLWTIELEPYDLAVVRFNAEEIRLSSPQVVFSAEANRSLAASIRDLHGRRVMLESPPPLPLLSNPGFELPARGGQIPGWSWNNGRGEQVTLDANGPREGRHAIHLETTSGAVILRSEPFTAPQTGRLAVSVWLKAADVGNPPRLWLVLEGATEGRPFYRSAALGQDQAGAPIPNQWKQFIFTVDDLPPDVPPQLRFRVDLLGPGEVWLDDVQLFDLVFNETEKIQLSKTIALADFQLNHGRLGDCLYELEGYWPRLLNAKAPLAAIPFVANPQAAPPPKDSPDKSATRPGMLDRIKDAWKR